MSKKKKDIKRILLESGLEVNPLYTHADLENTDPFQKLVNQGSIILQGVFIH